MHPLLVPGLTAALLLDVLPPEIRPVSAPMVKAAAARVVRPTPDPFYVGRDGQVITAERLARFLAPYDSPLLPHAAYIVATATRYRVDPRWIVAIAGTETTFGRYHKGYNAWGWDAPNGLRRWSSWEEAIESYTRHFSRGYRTRDPDHIGARYAPFAPEWPATTRLFFSRI
ncbi:Hypothetical protein A7982_02707 [Minicystis rosea]|nr:Hypothetical protein A7982_02707 [Minicystis rosea]